jgi:hypothetical protein
MYYNGLVVLQQTLGSFTPQTTYPLYLGQRPGSAAVVFEGLLDEVSIYNRALSSTEIAGIYNIGSGGKCPLPPAILVQPTNQYVAVGGTATFSVQAVGTQPLSYQWSCSETNIAGATNTSLTLTNVQPVQAGTYNVQVANAYGSVGSSNAVLAVGLPPTITSQPTNQTVTLGGTASFSVTATGSTPLTYQWKKNGANLIGATATNFTIISVQTNDAAIYSVAITNVFGSIISSNATLTVLAPPAIIVQPTNQTVVVSNSATFTVVAVGTPTLLYQWSFNGTNIVGATNTSLLLTNVQFSQSGAYAVAVTNTYGSILSSNAVLTVNPAPSCDPAPSGLVAWWPAEDNANDIVGTNNGTLLGGLGFAPGEIGQAFLFTTTNTTEQGVQVPASPSLNVGTGAGFTVESWVNPSDLSQPNHSRPIAEWNTGTGTYGVHFHINVTYSGNLYANIVDTTGTAHTIFTGAGILVTNVFQHIALTYDKASGVATMYCNSKVVLQQTVGSFTPQTTYPLYLGQRPGSASVVFDGLLDEVSIYNRALSSTEIAAIYNAGGSGKCPLPPTIFTQPTNQTAVVGGTATFSVTANGTQPLFYQWSFNGTNVSSATNTSLTLTNIQPIQAGTYVVQVANAGGSTNSTNAVLTVNAPPGITMQPANSTNVVGTTATFTVTASGSTPLNYLWKKNGTNLIGATGTNYTIVSVQTNDAGIYSVTITNAYGSIISSNAALTVNPLFHFIWNQIPSPRFVNVPFAVVIQAQNPTNGNATNFNNTVILLSTNGIPVVPAVSGNFIQGVWTGMVAVAQTATNLVLQASDSSGESGLANPINVISLPALTTIPSGGSLLIFWPVNPAGFVLEETAGLSPANWVPVTASPFQIGDQYLLSIQMSGTNAFYRLRFNGQ